MPKTRRPKRRQPVTTCTGNPSGTSTGTPVTLPPIHVEGQSKIIIDTGALSSVSRGKLGKSSTETRKRINHFHTLIKQYSKLAAKRKTASESQTAEIDQEIEKVSMEMTQMGGLDWYQKASLLGQCKQRGGDTSRWLVPKMKGLGMAGAGKRVRLLDVGALSCLNYEKERRWIDVTPIDLNSQEPGIYQQDFLDINLADSQAALAEVPKVPDEESDDDEYSAKSTAHLFAEPFDVICLSLVVNFIGDPVRRGDMLKQAARLLAPNGLLFLVLPLSCVNNSRYLDDQQLTKITDYLGFTELYHHHTAKLAHYLYRLTKTPPSPSSLSKSTLPEQAEFKKKLLHAGPGRNNFSIVL
ncbi:25S rRNA (adenine2142-N1)-methyltransferase [Coemansia sp. Benny D115]|nr:25S rRNA (adenine2142-N1)-methyltransferase [Coemansia sp. Benny D115]